MTAQRHAQASEPAAWTTEQVRIALAIAQRQASREARRFRLGRADRDDLAQDLLVPMIARRALYDPSAGSWQGFLPRSRATPCLIAGVRGAGWRQSPWCPSSWTCSPKVPPPPVKVPGRRTSRSTCSASRGNCRLARRRCCG